ncbi:SDR family oxidoreductase [uncultured Kocuria sp.]|uniref:SDR family oxidoreductase n=1 Tax=uncultured Kocuria sp. TaxID=259305 RepID=UPI00259571A3|nr:SDR family oxidoreductase [uncultured Kocuria sp.]MCT1367088.1 SDR family oxidoreductase [Rothia sp. p3-SID1597]
MKVVILGATGQMGRLLTRKFLDEGHDVVSVSRRAAPEGWMGDRLRHLALDLTSIPFPERAARWADAIIDVTDSRKKPALFQRIAHSVAVTVGAMPPESQPAVYCLGIVRQDKTSYGYYSGKANQDRIYRSALSRYSLISATQFTSFVEEIFAVTSKFGFVLAPRGIRWQLLNPEDLASEMVAVISEGKVGDLTASGPEILTSQEAATRFGKLRGRSYMTVGAPVPGALGKFLRSGFNLVENADIVGHRSYGELGRGTGWGL